jgi:glycosyltransferase involved in cell wall biosynthesis
MQMDGFISNKQKILVMIDWFWPGYKAGGPISAAVNFIKYMQHDYELYIFTSDRDLNDSSPYEGITINTWLNYENCKVFYSSPSNLSWKSIDNIIQQIKPDFVYLNSLFSRYFTIYPLLLYKKRNFSAKVILAPRGMLRVSALQFKSFKKKIFLFGFKRFGFHKSIFFQATDETEYNDIRTHFGVRTNVSLAGDFPIQVPEYAGSINKEPGQLKIIFVGRLHPIKQLDFLLRLLHGLKGDILLTIAGDEEDKIYVESCKKIMQTFSSNIKVVFKGGVPGQQLPGLLAQHHIFALPTKGENFGHAIFEALAQGRPVLISDQTPWLQLAAYKAGWDLPLAEPAAFRTVVEQAVAMDQQAYDEWSKAAWKFASNYIKQSNLITTYKNLFN